MWQGLVLEAKSLACERGGRVIFEGLDFVVRSGEAVELRGLNGSGKSSLLRLLAGLNKPAEGSVTFTGEISEQCHYLGHSEALKPSLSVKQNIDFWSKFLGGASDISTFKLDTFTEDDARFLSEGQRRRLALSRLLSVKRPLWLLDEPTVGLDQMALGDLRSEIERHMANGGLIIAATHVELGLTQVRSLHI